MSVVCGKCQAPLSDSSTEGLCPACLLKDGLELLAPETQPLTNDQHGSKGHGLRCGNYELLEEIARGGMGIVYRARQVPLNRQVAVKMILAGQFAGPTEVQRFRQEALAAAQLNHANIVAIYEVGEHEGQHFFSMEYIEGRSLAELQNQGPLSPHDAADLVHKIARAIHYAHEQGVLHRDLKPSNVLIDQTGQPRVTDFGLAKQFKSGSELTHTGQVLGTPSYMPPEQACGDRGKVGPWSDVYSLGTILYFLLTRRAPFTGETLEETLTQVLHHEPTSPRALNPRVTRDLETICLKCLEKEPHRRYGTALQLAQDLQRWLQHEPILARPVTSWERAVKWVRRRPVTAGLVAALAATVLLSAAVVYERHRARTASILTRLRAAETQFDNDNAPSALAALAKLLRDTPENQIAAERLLNALRQRVFLFPAGVWTNANVSNGRASASGSETPGETESQFNPTRSRRLESRDPLTIEVIEVTSGKTVLALTNNGHSKVIRAWRWSGDGSRIVTASADGTAKIWDADNGACLWTVPHDAGVTCADLNSNGTRLVTGTRAKVGAPAMAGLWKVGDATPLGSPMRHPNSINSVRFSPNGQLVITASDSLEAVSNSFIRVWKAESGQPYSQAFHTSSTVTQASFSSDGAAILLQLEGGQRLICRMTRGLQFWGTRPQDIPPASKPLPVQRAALFESGAPVNFVAASPDGRQLAISTSDRRVRLLDARTGHPLSDWIPSPNPVTQVWFSDDGRWLNTSAGWRWDLLLPGRPVPKWLPALAEAIGGIRLNAQNTSEPVPRETIRHLLETLSGASGSDPLAAWARQLIGEEGPAAPR